MESTSAAPPWRQITIVGLIAALLIVVMVAIYLLVFNHPYAVLFTNLRTADAATIVAELDKKKIPYRLKDGGATIMAPQNLIDATRLDVMSSDLPIKGTVGFELFNKSDMGLTEFAQRINYQRALQGELARTIMTMEAVDAARVHLAITEPTIFRDDRRPPKASVTILPRPGKAIGVDTVQGIRRLVAAAVPDLDISNVVVLNEKGAVMGAGPSQDRDDGSPQRQAIEQDYANRIRNALTALYPSDEIEVAVWADTARLPAATTGEATSNKDSEARNYRLRVSVTVNAPLTPRSREDVRTLTAEAMGYDDALGDMITITLPTAAAVQTDGLGAADPASSTASPSWPDRAPPSSSAPSLSIPWLISMLVVAILLAGSMLLLWRRRGASAPLSEGERADYVRRLQDLLAEEGAHG